MGRRALVPKVFLDAEHGEVYQFRFTVKGIRHRGSTYLRDQEKAQRFLDGIYANAIKGKGPTKRERWYSGSLAEKPLIDLFADFVASLHNKKSASYTEKMESHFRSHFAHRWASLDEIVQPGAIDKYASDRLSGRAPAVEVVDEGARKRRSRPSNASPVTVAKELVTLRRFLKWCRKHGHIDTVPDWETVKPVSDYAPPDYSPDDVRTLLAALPDRKDHRRRYPVREFFTVQWAQALRPGELESLRWQDVNLKRQEMTVRQSEDKARVGRVLQLVPDALAVLEQMEAGAGLIFGTCSFQRSLDMAAEETGLPRVTPHHFRHFRLTELGHLPTATPGALKAFAGHKHLTTTDRYIRSQAKAMRAMLAGLNSDPTGSQSKTSRRKTLPRRANKK